MTSPARSGATGLAVLGCTRYGHVTHSNNTASAKLPAENDEAKCYHGLARVTVGSVTRYLKKVRNGARVTTVRIQLLQGSDATSTVPLGNLALRVRRG